MIRLIIATLVGLSGLVAGYFNYQSEISDVSEVFVDPELRLRKASGGEEYIAERKAMGDTQDGAQIVVTNGTEYEFGRMETHTSRAHKFIFRNIGNKSSELRVLRSSCKCTIGSIADSVIGPNDETTIELTWTAENMLEEFAQTATIGTDDPLQPEIKLTVLGKVSGAIVVDPKTILFGDVSPAVAVTKTTTIYSNYKDALDIKSLDWTEEKTKEQLEIEYEQRKLEPGEAPDHPDAHYAVDVRVTTIPGIPAGRINCMATFETNVSQDFAVRVYCDGRVSETIRFIHVDYNDETRVLRIGNVDSAEGKTMSLLLGVDRATAETLDEPIELSVLSVVPSEAMNVTVGKPIEQRNQLLFPVKLEIPQGAPAVSYAGTNSKNFGRIIFRSNIPVAPEIPLYLRLVVAEE
jgi:hypothetical protein